MTINSRIFQTPKTRIFFKGLNPWFWPKKAKFFYLDLVKITLQIMLTCNYFEEKKETFFDYKKENFSKSKKSHFLSKRVNPCFWPKNASFSLFRFGQIRLEIMLSDFAEKKEACFDYKKTEFFKVHKNPLFPCFWCFLTFKRINKPFLALKKPWEFLKVQKIPFFQRG